MLCEACGKRPASVHVTKVMNNEKSESHLCQECAHEQGQFGFLSQPAVTFHNILAGLFDPDTVKSGPPVSQSQVRCENCGLSFGDFRRLGHLGCSECYTTFTSQLESLLRRVHGSTRHKGKVPSGGGREELSRQRRIEQLRQQLELAVEAEEYEKAAALRDQIRALEAVPEEGVSKE